MIEALRLRCSYIVSSTFQELFVGRHQFRQRTLPCFNVTDPRRRHPKLSTTTACVRRFAIRNFSQLTATKILRLWCAAFSAYDLVDLPDDRTLQTANNPLFRQPFCSAPTWLRNPWRPGHNASSSQQSDTTPHWPIGHRHDRVHAGWYSRNWPASGATPHNCARAASEWIRSGLSPVLMIRSAATIVPHPTILLTCARMVI